MHTEDEGGAARTRSAHGAGRGVAYWASADGADRRIIYVTPGYRMKALDAKTGIPIPAFGQNGAVDLKLEADQEIDLDTGELGLNATPLVVGDVIVVGAAHRPGSAPRTMRNAKGYVRGYDVRTGKRLWIFHTIPQRGEFGYDTWLEGSARIQRQHRRLGADERRPGARSRLRARRDADRRLLRRQPARRQPVRRQPGRARRQDREAQVALPDGAPRRLGLGPGVRADPVRHDRQRPHRQGHRAADEARVSLRLQSRDRRADLADRRAARAAVGRAEGAHQPDAAVPDQARAVRSAGHHRERPARPDAGAQGRGARGGQALQDGADLHAAGGELARRTAGDAAGARRRSAAPTGPAGRSIPRTTSSTSTRTRTCS